jgi:hypothetical protein
MGFDIGRCREDGAGRMVQGGWCREDGAGRTVQETRKLVADKRMECAKRRGKVGAARLKGLRKRVPLDHDRLFRNKYYVKFQLEVLL